MLFNNAYITSVSELASLPDKYPGIYAALLESKVIETSVIDLARSIVSKQTPSM